MTVMAGGAADATVRALKQVEQSVKHSCPGSEPEGGVMLEKLLLLILPLALAIGVWVAIALPWGVPA